MARATTGTVEVIPFRAGEGIGDGRVLAAADALQPDLEGYAGYISRRVLKAGEGQWIDVVESTGLPQAQQAADTIKNRPSRQAFMALVDASRITRLHVTPVRMHEVRGVLP